MREKRRLAQASNDLFFEIFPDAPKSGHPLSYFRWLPLDQGVNIPSLLNRLQSQGVRVFHSDRFLSGGRTPDNFLRVALASTPSLEQLEKGLMILKQAIAHA